jgi:hypothetical protein
MSVRIVTSTKAGASDESLDGSEGEKDGIIRRRYWAPILESHPRQWVDCSSSAYKRRRLDRFFESHPRQWVDRSNPAYKDSHSHPLVFVSFSPLAREGREGNENWQFSWVLV